MSANPADPEALLSRLAGVTQRRDGRWLACCPAHDDRSPSLAISYGHSGSLVIHCFAGCEAQSILDAVGLTFGDLYPKREDRGVRRYERTVFGRDAMRAMIHEVTVLQIISADFGRGIVSDELCKRAELASDRILRALEMCDG